MLVRRIGLLVAVGLLAMVCSVAYSEQNHYPADNHDSIPDQTIAPAQLIMSFPITLLPAYPNVSFAYPETYKPANEAQNANSVGPVWWVLFSVGDWLIRLVRDPLTVATVLLVGLTAWYARNVSRQTSAIAESAKAATESVNLARDEFVASHRPRLRVRNVVIDPMEHIPGWGIGEIPIGAGLVKGSFLVANHGDTRAYVIECYSRVYVGAEVLPLARPHEEAIPHLRPREGIESGYARKYWVDQDKGVVLRNDVATEIAQDRGSKLYIMGWIVYEDSTGVRRRTAFCRKYDATRCRFYPVDDADYEHEE